MPVDRAMTRGGIFPAMAKEHSNHLVKLLEDGGVKGNGSHHVPRHGSEDVSHKGHSLASIKQWGGPS